MTELDVDTFIVTNAKLLDPSTLYIVKRKLLALHDIKSKRIK